jgi:hypothetical protein
MMEDWLNNPKLVDDCHEQTVMQIVGEENSIELSEISAKKLNKR